MQLRDYQVRAVEMLRANWRDQNCLVMPTGAGKTVVAAAVIQGAIAKGRRAMIASHTRAIVMQTVKRFRDAGLDTGCIMGAETENTDAPVIVASIQTLNARGLIPNVDVLIIDEAHRAVSKSYRDLIAAYKDKSVIGLTATPCRLDGRGLREVGFTRILEPVSYADLFTSGALIKPRMFVPPGAPDMSNVRVVAGEFAGIELDDAARAITGNVVEHYNRFAANMRAVAFGVDVAHAEALAEAFNQAGIPAACLSGDSSQAERDAGIARLVSGEIKIITNCSLFGEGWDLPELEAVILARPTASLALHRQQVGRVMRSFPGKDYAVVVDAAGNIERHGAPWEPIVWTLDGVERKEGEYGEAYRRCEECFALFERNLKACPECGWSVPVAERKIEHREGELEEWKEKTEEEWYTAEVIKASRRGHKLGAARVAYNHRYGDWPKLYKLERLNYVCPRKPWQIDEADEAVDIWTGRSMFTCLWCRKKYPDAKSARVGHTTRDPERDLAR